MTTETVKSKKILEKTIATVTFDNGTVTTFDSDYKDTQGGVGYDAGTWGEFPSFVHDVEEKIKEAQRLWKLPQAVIRYDRVTKITETVERVNERSTFYRTRIVHEDKA